MTLKGIAHAYHRLLRDLAESVAADAASVWSRLDRAHLLESWTSLGLADELLVSVSQAQMEAADAAAPFVAAALVQQAVGAVPVGVPDARALAGIASDGRDLDSLLLQPVIRSLTAIGQGAPVPAALELGGHALDVIARSQVQDAGRAAAQVAMTVQPDASGWVRMLVPPSCGRCAILAGRWYRWSSGFDRHPGDDCVSVPATKAIAESLVVDPDAYFASLTAAEQDRHFTPAGAQAIRDGADIGQVVNARRGAAGLSRPGRLTADEQRMLRGGRDRARLGRVDVFGRPLHVTLEGTTRRGVAGRRLIASGGETGVRSRAERRADRAAGRTERRPSRARTPRLMPEAIAEIAGDDRELRVKLLRRMGYIL